MASYSGNLRKMLVADLEPVNYTLELGNESIVMNDLIGQTVWLTHSGKIHCLHCGRVTKTSFGQGYCYPCFQTIPETDTCILHPETCQAHLGISRDMEWSANHCLQPHVVYLALTSTVKVGVTRMTQIPIRWIDQGAWKTIRLVQTRNRSEAGRIEVSLKEHLTDKTNWRHMLTNIRDEKADLVQIKSSILQLIPSEYKFEISSDDTISEFNYPVDGYPLKVTSLGLEKKEKIGGVLTGIRGQYLIFDHQNVINIRKYSGFEVIIEI